MRPVVLSIAGSDPSGGAGIQADLKTMQTHGVYGAAAVALRTVQDTSRCHEVVITDTEWLRREVLTVAADLPVAAVKLGALGSRANVLMLAELLADPHAHLAGVPVVLDPVRIASRGEALLEDAARRAVMESLAPRCTLITPNIPEASWLIDWPELQILARPEEALDLLAAPGASVLLKGGHAEDDEARDWLRHGGQTTLVASPRLDTTAGHGTGCALSTSIACRLALGEPLSDAVRGAKAWLYRALAAAPGLGGGASPIDFFQAPDPE